MYIILGHEEARAVKLGWWLDRQGSNHEVWTNGKICESVPRHVEIGESLSKKILKRVKNNPPPGKEQ
jgi:mRNA interferase HicA